MLLSQRTRPNVAKLIGTPATDTFDSHDQDALRKAMIKLDGGKGKLPSTQKQNASVISKKHKVRDRRAALLSFIASCDGVFLSDVARAFPSAKKHSLRGDLQALTSDGLITSQRTKNKFRIWRAAQ